MTINPLIPSIPAVLSFFIYGYLSGVFFLLWKRSRWGCFLTLVFWYLYAVWCIFFFMLLGVGEAKYQIWFVLGGCLAFLRPLLQSAIVQNFLEDITHAGYLMRRVGHAMKNMVKKKEEDRSEQYQNHQQSQNTHKENNNSREQARRAEQAQREAEARARRAEREKSTNSQKGRAEDPRREPPPRPKPPKTDTRTPEEILGLKLPWTQEDLKTAYKREAQRTHPDKWIGKPEPIRQAMEEEYKAVQEAYKKLRG